MFAIQGNFIRRSRKLDVPPVIALMINTVVATVLNASRVTAREVGKRRSSTMKKKPNSHCEGSIRTPAAHPVIKAKFMRKSLQSRVSAVMARMMSTGDRKVIAVRNVMTKMVGLGKYVSSMT